MKLPYAGRGLTVGPYPVERIPQNFEDYFRINPQSEEAKDLTPSQLKTMQNKRYTPLNCIISRLS
jgi:hypothetical protein